MAAGDKISSSSVVQLTATTQFPVIQLTAPTHFPIKLTATNFTVWRKQVLSTLIGLDLDHHITGFISPPSEYIDGDLTKPNPVYILWYRQDQILISALLGSCSDTVQPIVSSSDTAKQAWDSLNASYASSSRSRIISLKSKLAKNPKGTRSVAEFLHDMKNVADELALAHNPVDDDDLIVHVLGQLGNDYNSIASAIKVRENPISFPELFDKLVDFERELHETNANSTSMLATVNYTSRSQSRSFKRPAQDNRSTHNNSFSNYNRNPRSSWAPNTSSITNRSSNKSSFCQFCNIPGHETKDCRKLTGFLRDNNITIASSSTAPMVNTSSARPINPVPQWMLDTGASHHVTSDQGSLHTLSEYGGPDEIVLGDGLG